MRVNQVIIFSFFPNWDVY